MGVIIGEYGGDNMGIWGGYGGDNRGIVVVIPVVGRNRGSTRFFSPKRNDDWSWIVKRHHTLDLMSYSYVHAINFCRPFRNRWCFVCIVYFKSMFMLIFCDKKIHDCLINGDTRANKADTAISCPIKAEYSQS